MQMNLIAEEKAILTRGQDERGLFPWLQASRIRGSIDSTGAILGRCWARGWTFPERLVESGRRRRASRARLKRNLLCSGLLTGQGSPRSTSTRYTRAIEEQLLLFSTPPQPPQMNVTLPDAANPYLALQQVYLSRVYLSAGPSFTRQINALSGILAVSLVLDLVSLVLRWYRGTLWIVRLERSCEGTWIVMHHISAWVVSSACFHVCEDSRSLSLSSSLILIRNAVMQPYIHALRLWSTSGSSMRNLMLWRFLVW